MRSDREELPEGFTKEDADKAEIFEAELLKKKSMQRGINALAAPTDCMPYWPTQFQVCGEIRVKYDSLGGSTSFLGPPSANDVANPDNYGRRQTFWNGPIYWSPVTGAHPVVNSFLNRWSVYQYEAGRLKYPTTDEIVLPDGGRRQEFQQGAIYVAFQNAIGSAIFNGPLRDKYNSVGGLAPANTLLGYPTQDQFGLPDGQGQSDRFQNGVIYWSPATGAHPVTGGILSTWAYSGYETGSWGYPTGDAIASGANTSQQFERGKMTFPFTDAGAVVDDGEIDPLIPDGTPTTRAEYAADARVGVSPNAPYRLIGSNNSTNQPCPDGDGTTRSTCVENADLEEPDLSAPDTTPTDVLTAACFDSGKTPIGTRWHAQRKLACTNQRKKITALPLPGVDNGGVQFFFITSGIATSHRSGGFVQEYRISFVSPFGTVGIPKLRYSATATNHILNTSMTVTGPAQGTVVGPNSSFDIRVEYKALSQNFGASSLKFTKLEVWFENAAPTFNTSVLKSSVVLDKLVRCDATMRGSGGNPRQGCVFHTVQPEWVMDANAYPNATAHVVAAIASGLPGGSNERPLRRQANVTERNKNRNEACPYSAARSEPRRRDVPTRSCDEYPMASTRQGAASYPNDGRTFNPQCHIPDLGASGLSYGYSVCMIDDPDNRRAGSNLGAFYGTNRVIDNDAFYINAAGGTLPPIVPMS